MPEKLSHTARLHRVEGGLIQQRLTLLQTRYPEVAEDSEHPPFFFDAEISNNLLDSHYTHMSESTLNNYAEDAKRGVAFLRGHNWSELPIGYSLDANLESSAERQRVVASFYTVSGLSATDDLIARMKTGLVRDVSVGFHGGRAVCDICGQDFWDCRHFPGLKYEEKEGDTIRTLLATFTIEDARLSEVSGVFDGSTPEAMILKAERAAKAGELTPQQIELLESRYRIALPTRKVVPMPEETKPTRTLDEKQFQRLVDNLCIHNLMPEEERKTVTPDTAIAYVELAGKRIKELEPQAEEGRQYRKDLVAEALAEGVRAQGNDFDKTLYEGTLNAAPLPVIKRMKEDWKKIADKSLTGGRSTVDGDERQQRKVTASAPDEAYR
jgi:hypothetical protein